MSRCFAAALLLVAACNPSRRETLVPPSASAAAAPGSAVARAPEARARAADPRWIAARDEDLASVMRLAAFEGAAGLLDGLDDGGAIAATALEALPYADDGEAALGRLGALASAAPSERLGPLLVTILALAEQPWRPREALDPEGARSCAVALITLAGRADATRGERAIAVSAARALAAKGYADARLIRTDLDPK